MSYYAMVGSLQLGLIYGIASIAVLLTFRMINFPDLTVDGSFPLGAAAAAAFIIGGGDPWVSLCVAFSAGALAGILTAILSERFGIYDLLAGLLSMTALYSINIRVMGRPNLPLLGQDTVIDDLMRLGLSPAISKLAISAIFCVGSAVVVAFFLASRYGLGLRAVGANRKMAVAVGMPASRTIYIGLALSNGLCGLAGAIFAQIYGFADVTMGIGTIVIGLAAVILGEAFVRSWSPVLAVMACVTGAIVYRFTVAIALESEFVGLSTSDLNLISAMVVGIAFYISKKSRQRRLRINKEQLREEAVG